MVRWTGRTNMTIAVDRDVKSQIKRTKVHSIIPRIQLRNEPCMLSYLIVSKLLVPYISSNNFYGHSPPSTDSRRGVVSYNKKYVHEVLVK